uniref:Uncharacterized protein n=1 Tax=viral metagenome TaxID=1070528 RepID=A0A6C0KQW4_9ZZZZ
MNNEIIINEIDKVIVSLTNVKSLILRGTNKSYKVGRFTVTDLYKKKGGKTNKKYRKKTMKKR